MRRIWVDISDLFDFLSENARPSGIQRVTIEIARALVARAPQQVRFVWRYGDAMAYAVVPWGRIEELLAAENPPEAIRAFVQAGRVAQTDGLPDVDSTRLFDIARTQWAVVKSLLRPSRQGSREEMAALAQPGDLFFVPGSPWRHRDYATTMRWVRDGLRMRFVPLLHDLIPVVHPEWCAAGIVEEFVRWHRSVLPMADHVFVNSTSTARDLAQCTGGFGWADMPVSVLPFGCAFQPPSEAAVAGSAPLIEGEYILCVSTIEGRKNHELLLRVWRHLLEVMPPRSVPKLVLAGKRGWLVEDLMRQFDFSDWLDGHIVHIPSASDMELVQLYRGCLFTVFPSLYEGWGLPVVESLSLGKPCLAADTSSLPEAGGDFARYFNPRHVGDAARAIRALLEDRAGLAAWEARVVASYVPQRWSVAADRLLGIVESF